MVRKISDQGTVYHEPPYTEAEQMEMYRRMNGVVAFTRPCSNASGEQGGTPKPITRDKGGKRDAVQ